MAQASTYFYDGNDPGRQTLHRRICPSDSQFDAQQDRWNSLRDYLLPKLKERSGHSMNSWLQGSYKSGTQIRPVRIGGEFDIDLGVYYCWKGSDDEGNYGPQELKSFVQDALFGFAKENNDVVKVASPPRERCCRIHFEGAFHIDVPVYHLDEGRDHRALATEDDEWEASDPKAFYLWFVRSFADYLRSRVRRIIRYLKAWVALKYDPAQASPSSVLITVLVANAVNRLADSLPAPEDEAFRDIVTSILDEIGAGQNVPNPADPSENLAARMSTDEWETLNQKMQVLVDKSVRAVECTTAAEACSVWSTLFEHLFPLPEVEELQELAKNLPALITLPEVAVNAVSRDNRHLHYDGMNGIGPIPKNCDITFRITNADRMPAGTQYMWMVRNEGEEAEDVNDLGHQAGTTYTAHEYSAYNGDHYMDCTAIAHGRVVGIRRVKVRISGMRAPKRNPPKPRYVSLRGRH